jgi:hypothetical protein
VSSDLGRMDGGDGTDSMLQFWLKGGGDGMKRCRKMNWRQRAHLSSMERKHDAMWWHGNVGQRRGSTGEGKGRR